MGAFFLFIFLSLEKFISSFQFYNLLFLFSLFSLLILFLGGSSNIFIFLFFFLFSLHGLLSLKHVLEDYIFDGTTRFLSIFLLNLLLLRFLALAGVGL